MITPEKYISSDGELTLAVESYEDGNVRISFRNYPWHTYANILANIGACSESEAVRAFVNDVLNDHSLIAMQFIDHIIRDIWISGDPLTDCRYKQANETLRFRYWSGTIYELPIPKN